MVSCHPGRDLRPGLDAELIQDIQDVRVDGPLGDHELCGNRPIAEPLSNEGGCFRFTPAEWRRAAGLGLSGRSNDLFLEGEAHRFLKAHQLTLP